MGKSSAAETPGAHSTVEKKRRRLHPIRRIAKFLLGGSKQKKKRDTTTDGNQEPEGKTCHGASRWQNVLPFLEPLIALDPKLSFIEDRILKRPTQSANEKARQQQRQQPKPEPPRTLRDLQQRVQDENVFCNCDECAPKYYKISTTNSHGTIRDVPSTSQRALSSTTTTQKQSFLTPSQLRNSAAAAIGPQLELRFHGTYEAMSLVRHHIAWLDATYIHPSATPTPAVKQLGALLTTWHPHLSSANLRHTLSTRQLATLFSHLNTVFFNGCIPPHNATLTAGFGYLCDTATDCFGKSSFNPLLGTQILLHPCLWRGQHTSTHGHGTTDAEKSSSSRYTKNTTTRSITSRIATLLHEMSHAYLKAYACATCPTHASSIGPLGHGRAWQCLAAKLEHVAAVILGQPVVDLGRAPALLRDVACGAALPSLHDLGVWGMLGDARRELGREDSGVGGVERPRRGGSAGGSSGGEGRLWWLADSSPESREGVRRSVRLVFEDEDG
ncbi:hypothetical protein PTNB73_10050 [Pyrenophora teres f. teres]|nr:hypothetical protein PTNB73_10050 [Pyrenophora teres f. teres]